jgi:tetratricopeptide (TPR) repeat protein
MLSVNVSQEPAAVAVVVQTILRPSLGKAIRSIFHQDFVGRIHLLIGIDVHRGDATILTQLAKECPPHVTMTVLDPGYSTSRRHGGTYPNYYGGSLRTVLSYLANSRLIAYLDDNDWYAGNHLSALTTAIKDKDWAWSGRWLVHQDSLLPICRDEWDSVGDRPGINAERYGGFVQPSGLMMDKEACHFVFPFWSVAAFPDGTGEDRLVFNELHKTLACASTNQFTCFCTMSEHALHGEHHQREFSRRGVTWVTDAEQIERIGALVDEAKTQAEQGDWAGVKRAADRVLKIHPHHPEAHFLLGRQCLAFGKKDDAIKAFSTAIAIDDSHPEWLEVLADLLKICRRKKDAQKIRDSLARRFPA